MILKTPRLEMSGSVHTFVTHGKEIDSFFQIIHGLFRIHLGTVLDLHTQHFASDPEYLKVDSYVPSSCEHSNFNAKENFTYMKRMIFQGKSGLPICWILSSCR